MPAPVSFPGFDGCAANATRCHFTLEIDPFTSTPRWAPWSPSGGYGPSRHATLPCSITRDYAARSAAHPPLARCPLQTAAALPAAAAGRGGQGSAPGQVVPQCGHFASHAARQYRALQQGRREGGPRGEAMSPQARPRLAGKFYKHFLIERICVALAHEEEGVSTVPRACHHQPVHIKFSPPPPSSVPQRMWCCVAGRKGARLPSLPLTPPPRVQSPFAETARSL